MARDTSGVYTLPNTVNPVVSRTPITADWANTTLNDIEAELTNSLDRAGRGAMTQPLQLPDGSAAAPALTWSADTNTGLYRTTTDSIGVSTGGTLRLTIASALATAAVPIGASDGTVGAPGLTFSGDLNTGIYRAGADDLRIAAGGVAVLGATASGINFPVAITGALTISGAIAATAGITVTQGTTNTVGATITGNGNQAGALITGGSGGIGADIRAGGGNSNGAVVTPTGSGTGLDVQASGTSGYGITVQGNGTRAPLFLAASSAPSSGSVGSLYIDSTGILWSWDTSAGPGWKKVGTQA